jgi:hypothetical protein
MRLGLAFALSLLAASSVPLLADDAIPYPNPGTIAPQVNTYANTSGGVDIYYFGSTASFTDYVSVYDIQTGYNSGEILDNHTTVVGSELTVGAAPGQINNGDQLVFYINSPEGNFASLDSYSADGVNHAYITPYSGGTLNSTTIPPGIFVGLEDEINGASDFNYNDDTFVFTGVSAPSIGVGTNVTPEPSSFVLLGTGVLAAAESLRRKIRRA